MALLMEEKKFRQEEFNVRFVKCTEPILIRDESKTEEENKILRDTGYPTGYDELLDCVFPPEEWEEDGKTWRRVASTTPTSRKEMSLLERELSSQKEYWQINNQGLCHIRREMYLRYFDELIRQVCIFSIDLGELFIRIRDDFKLTIETYENIYKESLLFSSKKTVADDRGANTTQYDLKNLEDKNDLSRRALTVAKRDLQNLKDNCSEELNTLKAANDQELNFFKKNHDALKDQYNILITNAFSDISV